MRITAVGLKDLRDLEGGVSDSLKTLYKFLRDDQSVRVLVLSMIWDMKERHFTTWWQGSSGISKLSEISFSSAGNMVYIPVPEGLSINHWRESVIYRIQQILLPHGWEDVDLPRSSCSVGQILTLMKH